MSLSYVSSLLGILAFALIMWRVVATWGLISSLSRALAILLAFSLIIGAVSGVLNPASGGEFDTVAALRILHRVACIGAALWWNIWVCPQFQPVETRDDGSQPAPELRR